MYPQNYRLWKTSSDHSVKSAVPEDVLTVNMWKFPEYFQISMRALLSSFFIILRDLDLENVFPNNRWNLKFVV